MKLDIQLFGGRGASSSNNITQSQLDAIEYYVSGEGMWINQYLRGRGDFGELSQNEKDFLNDLEKITNSDTIKEDTLYRTVDASAIFGDMTDSEFDDFRSEIIYNSFSKAKGSYSQGIAKNINNRINNAIGKTYNEKGFMSTTKSLNIAENNMYTFGSQKPVIMEIKNTRGTKGRDVMKNASQRLKNVEKSDPQKEVLLARNKKYKIDSVSNKNGNIYVKARLV